MSEEVNTSLKNARYQIFTILKEDYKKNVRPHFFKKNKEDRTPYFSHLPSPLLLLHIRNTCQNA